MHLRLACFLVVAWLCEASAVSFRNDVMAVLSKAGCNAGACHGNKNGKGGFKLSLRGEDPGADHTALTRDMYSRRTNALEPAKSLILQKATAEIAHEGGLRFRPDSPEYKVLHGWVAAGTPGDGANVPTLRRLEVTPGRQVLIEPLDGARGGPAVEAKITATAVFSDGA